MTIDEYGWQNVAHQSMGTTCTASTTYDLYWSCMKAIDGLITYSSQWATQDQGTGAWIKLYFNGIFYINYTRIMQRFSIHEQFKTIEMTYGKEPILQQVN